ncbi:hypothetical protein EV361DRAFT_855572 [Lentinula raphanica]|nr:hypothetical protein EV361DRAFT_855572 [Lentinula raphanica]
MSHTDECHSFYMEAHSLTSHAKFIINSFPNAEVGAVEAMVHKLYAIRSILRELEDPRSTSEELEHLKDSLESFRKIFKYLEDNGLLDMTNNIQRLCLYVVFQPRIQQSLNRTADAWNQHRISTAGHKTPIALYELSREHAKTRGYWTGDPGDDIRTARDPLYGLEAELDGGMPGDHQVPEEDSADIRVNDEDAILYARSAFKDMGFDVEQEDGNWGIENYCQAVLKFKAFVESQLP